ncbi:MAG: hypothetical protein LQ340_002063 [Diploschistes diacapsis]|nr:MAG: hypothetical protein LQ340_002063 [Diploschistes diacapsis]
MGYDIADYKDVDPMYGTLADVDELIRELHKQHMKLMMDLVVNHTSNEHAWFVESKSSKTSSKRDWYIWKSPKGRTSTGEPIPPNNWAQLLGDANSAWTYDPSSDEFYLSLFTPEQPDLNWENPAVREAVHDVLRFWLSRGCSGFRMDVINHISKDQRFPDAPPNMGPAAQYHLGAEFFANGPRMHEYLQDIHNKVLSHYDTITVGEMPFVTDINEIIRTVGSEARELNMIFIFDIVNIDGTPENPVFSIAPFDASDISRILSSQQLEMTEHDGWNSLFVENHDQPRSVSRFVDDSDAWREKGAKLLALMQTTLAGTLYVYQGEELGMRNVPRSWDPAVEYKDILSQNFWKKSLARYGGGKDPAKLEHAKEILARKARDNARTPFQWDGGPNAGFCREGVEPWMTVNEDYRTVNAAKQLEEGAGEEGLSTFRFWKRGLASRKAHIDVFVYGSFEVVGATRETEHAIFAYTRTGDKGGKWLVVLNFSKGNVEWDVPEECEVDKWVAGNYGKGEIEKAGKGRIVLRPWEAILGKCSE